MLLPKTQEVHLKKYHLVTAEPPIVSKRSTLCTRQDLGKERSILQYAAVKLGVYRVCHCVGRCVKKWKLFLSSTVVKGTVLLGYVTSQQMSDAVITSFITILSFSKTVHQCILRST